MRTILILILTPLVSAAAEVPVGEVMKFNFTESKIYPGTMRDVWVYVPKQYDGKTPACLWVNQDGIQFGAVKIDKEGKVVAGGAFDKLIAEKKMPLTIGVFVKPGVAKALIPNALDRINRSYEYDSLGDNYAKFLIDELLPAVEKMSTPDGRKIILSKDPNDRGIGGSSSGAICAFTVAWERPDSFRRVFSSIGSYADLRGGHNYPNLIRKMEPKPLRIFLEDGSGDLNNYAGDWWLANQQMEKALAFMGYEMESKWGTGGHDQKHATEIFPDAMAWLWKDHPQPVKTGECKNDFLKDIIIPGEEWNKLSHEFGNATNIIAGPKGQLIIQDWKSGKLHLYQDNKLRTWLDHGGQYFLTLFCFDVNNCFYTTKNNHPYELLKWNMDSESSTVHETNDRPFHNYLVFHDNSQYSFSYINSPDRGIVGWNLNYADSKGEKKQFELHNGFIAKAFTALSPDHSLLLYSGYDSKFVNSYQIQQDKSIVSPHNYVSIPENPGNMISRMHGMTFDQSNRLWVSTKSGIQIVDREGRIHAIIPTPNSTLNGISFGGPDFNILYAASGTSVYYRKVNARGVNNFDLPFKPATPKK